jgi:hypothetical protein
MYERVVPFERIMPKYGIDQFEPLKTMRSSSPSASRSPA